MTTIKLGSKGDQVKYIQQLLGLTVDGDFGPMTEKSVKEWQAKHKLTADGIIGNKTWDVMFIQHKHLSKHITQSKNRTIKYIVVHYTAGSTSKPGKAFDSFVTFNNASASADFVIDDANIVQYNPDIKNYYCWAIGDAKKADAKLYGIAKNSNTINIEICSTCIPATKQNVSVANHEYWSYTNAVLDKAKLLIQHLMDEYNIPIDNVIRHFDVTGKLCPGIKGWNTGLMYNSKIKNTDDSWKAFKNSLISPRK